MVVILERENFLKEAKILLENLKLLPNTVFYYPGIEDELEIIDAAVSNSNDFDDNFQIYAALKFDAEIATFDKDFKSVKNVRVKYLE